MIPSFKFLIALFPAFWPLCSSEISILVAATNFTLEFQEFFFKKQKKKKETPFRVTCWSDQLPSFTKSYL